MASGGHAGTAAGSGVFGADPARRRFWRIVCLGLAALGWANAAILGNALLARRPPAAGFDLELVLDAARRVAAGASPYDPRALVPGLGVRDLFYTYPPFAAQVLAPLSGLPSWVVLTAQCVAAVAGLLVIGALTSRCPIGRPVAAVPGLSLDSVLVVAAVGPFFFPFVVALLFGNVDAWFPLLLGAVVLAVPAGGASPSRAGRVLGGVGLGLAAAIKIHPGSLVLWLLVRAASPGDAATVGAAPRAARELLTILGAAFVTGAVILLASLAVGGPGPWLDYFEYARHASNVDLAAWVNVGPASIVALVAGNHGLAQPLGWLVGAAALAATVVAARLVRDPLESVSLAILASLVVLPITAYHYPVALIPVALAAWTRSRGAPNARRVSAALLGAVLLADAAIALPVLLWLSVPLLLAGTHLAARPGLGSPLPQDVAH